MCWIKKFLKFHVKFEEMRALVKKGKKRVRNAGGDDQPAEDIKNCPSQVQYPSYREEEEDLVDSIQSPQKYIQLKKTTYLRNSTNCSTCD